MINQTYLHKKSGGHYRVLHRAKNEADLVAVIVYQSLSTGEIWVRPAAEFLDGRFVETDGLPDGSPATPGEAG